MFALFVLPVRLALGLVALVVGDEDPDTAPVTTTDPGVEAPPTPGPGASLIEVLSDGFDDITAGSGDDTIDRDEDGMPTFPGVGLTGNSDAEVDTLNRGAGADVIFLGGGDEFAVRDWIATGAPAMITDFEASSDIVVAALADDNANATVDIEEDGQDTRHIGINGTRVASVIGTFDQLDGVRGRPADDDLHAALAALVVGGAFFQEGHHAFLEVAGLAAGAL